MQKNLHVLKVKGDRVGLEKIVSDHTREMKAEHVVPRKRPIIKTWDVFFLYVSEGKLMHCVRHDLQRPASAGTFSSFVFLQLDPGFLDNRLRKLYPGRYTLYARRQ